MCLHKIIVHWLAFGEPKIARAENNGHLLSQMAKKVGSKYFLKDHRIEFSLLPPYEALAAGRGAASAARLSDRILAFGQSKYYVDSLSENTKRGLRQKVKRGEYPSLAPIGYINDSRNKSVVVDKKQAPVIRKAFELYAQGDQRLEDIGEFLAQHKLVSRSGKRIHISRATFILSNPFYTGLFRYAGEIYEGKYEPIIAKKLFDRVQEVLKQRGRPRHKSKIEPQVFCGLLHCATCGMMITGEYRVKTQKNGTQHFYTYYHCTKKRKNFKCPEPCIRQEKLDEQISSLLQKVSLPADWAEKLNARLEKDKSKSAQSVSAFVQTSQERVKVIATKLQRLLDGYLEQDIEREIYRTEKAKLLSEKKSLEEQMTNLEQKQNGWLEPMTEWIKVASSLEKTARDSNLFLKKVAAEQVFDSNLVLVNREARLRAPSGEDFPPQNQWAALCAAHRFVGQKPESLILELLLSKSSNLFYQKSIKIKRSAGGCGEEKGFKGKRNRRSRLRIARPVIRRPRFPQIFSRR